MTEADIERVIQSLLDWRSANPLFLVGVELSAGAVCQAMARYDAVILIGKDARCCSSDG